MRLALGHQNIFIPVGFGNTPLGRPLHDNPGDLRLEKYSNKNFQARGLALDRA